MIEHARSNATLPDTFPAFSDLLVDAAGNVWVREYLPPSLLAEQPPRWFNFDVDGSLRWTLRAPH